MNLKSILAATAAAGFMTVASVATAGILDDVKKKGFLQCGVNTGLAGFSAPNDKGKWEGFDVDFCRAMSAAIFGNADKVKYTPLTSKERFTALQSGEVDVLARNTTWTFTRDVKLGLEFIGSNYTDGQGFMVRKSLGVKSSKELDGAAVCIQTGTTTELNLADYFRANKMKFTSVVFERADEIRAGYDAGRCDVYTTDRSGLAAQRSLLSKPNNHMVLPEVISKEPLGPVIRHGDNKWGDVARWSLYALIVAEELGITSKNADQMKKSSNPEVLRLLGVEGKQGEQLGVGADWAYNIVTQVGNYGEVYERHVGIKTPLMLERGLNQLWSKGGLLYAPPFR
ncbi:MAG: amino acid ABC transporter substrate-binding protein [Alphaproteobacteria bacterium]